MPRLTIAATQYHAVAADIDRNLGHHLTFIRQAAEQHVQLLMAENRPNGWHGRYCRLS